MADQLCGPSNALKSFQKHTGADRTLQQDRLVSRQARQQGFRSSPGPNGAPLDSEFAAFQAGQMPLGQDSFQPFGLQPTAFQNQGFRHTGSSQNLKSQYQAGPSNWASDFQRMGVTPERQQQTPHLASQKQEKGAWGQDFNQQFNQTLSRQRSQGFAPQPFSSTPMSMMQPQFAGGPGQYGSEPMMNAQQQQPVDAFDEDAFARAFDEAAKLELEADTQVAEGFEEMQSEDTEELHREEAELLSQPRIGSDQLYDSERGVETPVLQDDSDELARTAGQLLESVSNNHSSKFQNSQFLKLMQQFRDQEVVVQGDKIVARNGQSDVEGNIHEARSDWISISNRLRDFASDSNRFRTRAQSPLDMRELLQTLLHLDRMCRPIHKETKLLEHAKEAQNVLKMLLNHPGLQNSRAAAPSLAILIIYEIDAVLEGCDVTEILTRDIEDAAWITALQQIHTANSQITHILPLTAPFPDEPFDVAWISRQLVDAIPSDLFSQLLGYNISLSKSFSRVHFDRLRDIMGPDSFEVWEICLDRGLLSSTLSHANFQSLVEACGTYGLESPAFKHVLREVENGIEDTRRQMLRGT